MHDNIAPERFSLRIVYAELKESLPALVRKFILLDVRTASLALPAALGAAAPALGLVYWLTREPRQRVPRPPG